MNHLESQKNLALYLKIFPLIPFIFPLYLIRFQLLFIPTNLLELTIAFSFLYLLAKKGRTIRIPIFWSWCFFLGASVLALLSSKFLSLDFIRSLGWWKGFIATPMIFMVLFENLPLDKKEALMHNFILAAALLGIGSFFAPEAFTVDGRLSGFFVSANFLAFFLSPALLSFFSVFRAREKLTSSQLSKTSQPYDTVTTQVSTPSLKKLPNKSFPSLSKQIFQVLVFLSILVPLFFTQSYLAIFSCIFLVSVWKLLEFREEKKIDFRLFLGIFSFLILFAFAFHQTEKWQKVFDLDNRSSISVRAQVYRVSFSFLKEHPFLGIGLGNYRKKYEIESPEILGKAPFEWVMRHTHNLFLSIWLNLGFLGFLGFLNFFILVIKKVFRPDYRELDKEKKLFTWPQTDYFLYAMPFFYFALHGMLDTPFWKNDLGIIFFLCLGWALNFPSKQGVNKNEE